MNKLLCENKNIFQRKILESEKKRVERMLFFLENEYEKNEVNEKDYLKIKNKFKEIFETKEKINENKIKILLETRNYLIKQFEKMIKEENNFLLEEVKNELNNINNILKKYKII